MPPPSNPDRTRWLESRGLSARFSSQFSAGAEIHKAELLDRRGLVVSTATGTSEEAAITKAVQDYRP